MLECEQKQRASKLWAISVSVSVSAPTTNRLLARLKPRAATRQRTTTATALLDHTSCTLAPFRTLPIPHVHREIQRNLHPQPPSTVVALTLAFIEGRFVERHHGRRQVQGEHKPQIRHVETNCSNLRHFYCRVCAQLLTVCVLQNMYELLGMCSSSTSNAQELVIDMQFV